MNYRIDYHCIGGTLADVLFWCEDCIGSKNIDWDWTFDFKSNNMNATVFKFKNESSLTMFTLKWL